MHVPCTIRVDFVPGTGPGATQSVVNYVAADGTILDAGEPTPVKAGQSITVGPVQVEVQLGTKSEHGETPKPGKPAPKKPSTPPAA